MLESTLFRRQKQADEQNSEDQWARQVDSSLLEV